MTRVEAKLPMSAHVFVNAVMEVSDGGFDRIGFDVGLDW
jgi:hypothetical protein